MSMSFPIPSFATSFTHLAGVPVRDQLTVHSGLIASVLTLYYRAKIMTDYDYSWRAAEALICVQVEIFVTISVSCMPSLAPFWNKVVVKSSFYSGLRYLLHTRRFSRSNIRTSVGIRSNHLAIKRSSRAVERKQTDTLDKLYGDGFAMLSEVERCEEGKVENVILESMSEHGDSHTSETLREPERSQWI